MCREVTCSPLLLLSLGLNIRPGKNPDILVFQEYLALSLRGIGVCIFFRFSQLETSLNVDQTAFLERPQVLVRVLLE
jgi:hypothetical protein